MFEYNGSPWEWQPLGMAAPGSGGPWGWLLLGVAAPGNGGPRKWRPLEMAAGHPIPIHIILLYSDSSQTNQDQTYV